jgi:metal-responsive CopG/Arc/MetJ family transcriptional regulator
MTTTVKRVSFCLTKETQRQLDEICKLFQENRSQVIIRAIQSLYFSLTFCERIPGIKTKEDI